MYAFLECLNVNASDHCTIQQLEEKWSELWVTSFMDVAGPLISVGGGACICLGHFGGPFGRWRPGFVLMDHDLWGWLIGYQLMYVFQGDWLVLWLF